MAYAPEKTANAGAKNVIYVDIDSGAQSRGQTGKRWKKAYDNLQDALDDAEATPDKPKQIWVADGTYTPSETYLRTGEQ